MPVGMMIWLTLVALVGLTWSLRQFAVSRALAGDLRLTPSTPPPITDHAPRVSLLEAATGEENHRAPCVETLLG